MDVLHVIAIRRYSDPQGLRGQARSRVAQSESFLLAQVSRVSTYVPWNSEHDIHYVSSLATKVRDESIRRRVGASMRLLLKGRRLLSIASLEQVGTGMQPSGRFIDRGLQHGRGVRYRLCPVARVGSCCKVNRN